MSDESMENRFVSYPKFFVKVDSDCETVIFDCLGSEHRKSSCKKGKAHDRELEEKILSCLISYATKSKITQEKAKMIASNCIKQDAHFKHLGFLDKESLDEYMSQNFAPLYAVKPKSVGWRRFLLDAGAVYDNKQKDNK
ncbi:MAG: nitrogen fixation protein NifQ [Campylobacterales bacterium]